MNTQEILALYVVAAMILIGCNGLIVAIFAASHRSMSALIWDFITYSAGASAHSLVWSLLAIMTIGLFQDVAVGWRIYSALFALALLATIVSLWLHAYRSGLKAPLVFTVSALVCLGLLTFNAVSLGKAWLYVTAVGAYLFMVGVGNYWLLLYEMRGDSDP